MNVQTIDWLSLKRRWLTLNDGWASQPEVATYFGRSASGFSSEFSGATKDQTDKWLTDGYELPGFTGGSVVFTPKKRRRPVWAEDEGQIDRCRKRAGFDDYRLTREPRAKPRAAKVDIGYGFRGNVPAEVIGQYGKIAAGIIRKLEGEGLDVEVNLVSRSKSYIYGVKEECELRLRVKKIGERSDFKSWSALFAPSGHRHLIFCGRAMHADALGLRCSTGFGGSMHRKWSVKLEDDTIKLDCDSFSEYDPTKTLTNQAKEVGIL